MALPGDAIDPVAALASSEAAQFFIERARAVQPGFVLTAQNATAVAEICSRLDGIPLGIELAAAWVRILGVEQVASRLRKGFRLLSRGRRPGPARQQTMRAALDWSYRLLSDTERKLFRRLAVFAGSFTVEAAEGICGDEGSGPEDIVEGLAALVDKSLLLVHEWGDETRYRLLGAIREYAEGYLVEANEAELQHVRHLDWYLGLAEHAERELLGPRQHEWLGRLDAEVGNLRAALEWSRTSDPLLSARLVGALWLYWFIREQISEGCRWAWEVLDLVSDDPGLRAKILLALGFLTRETEDFLRARPLTEESLALFRDLGDQGHCAWALHNLGCVSQMGGDHAAPRAFLEDSVALFRKVGDRAGIGLSLRDLGVAAEHIGDYGRARALFEESLALLREVGDNWSRAWTLHFLGELTRVEGDHARARALFEDALSLFRSIGDRGNAAMVLRDFGGLARSQGECESARDFLAQAMNIYRELGWVRYQAVTLCSFGILAADAGAHTRAVQLIAAASSQIPLDLLQPPERATCDASLAAARVALGEEAYGTAWAKGQGMTVEQAIADALINGGGQGPGELLALPSRNP